VVGQSGDIRGLFVSLVEGKAICLARETIEGLSALCGELQFQILSRRSETFKTTPTYQFGLA
jgi:hypothetical protein